MRFPSFKNKVIAIFFIVAILISSNVFKNEIKGFFYFISSPLQSFLWKQGGGVSQFFSSFFTTAYLKQTTDFLRAENYSLKAQLVQLQGIEKENEQLRQALALGIRKDFAVELVNIVGKDPTEDTIIIDRGKNIGLAPTMPVITPSKVLVGKIVEVFDAVSKVELISNKKSSFEVRIPSKSITGLLRGQGSSRILFDLIPKDKDIAQGDVVVTTNLGGIFPENLLVGSVTSIEKNDVEPFQKASLTPFFDLNSSNIVFVITKKEL